MTELLASPIDLEVVFGESFLTTDFTDFTNGELKDEQTLFIRVIPAIRGKSLTA